MVDACSRVDYPTMAKQDVEWCGAAAMEAALKRGIKIVKYSQSSGDAAPRVLQLTDNRDRLLVVNPAKRMSRSKSYSVMDFMKVTRSAGPSGIESGAAAQQGHRRGSLSDGAQPLGGGARDSGVLRLLFKDANLDIMGYTEEDTTNLFHYFSMIAVTPNGKQHHTSSVRAGLEWATSMRLPATRSTNSIKAEPRSHRRRPSHDSSSPSQRQQALVTLGETYPPASRSCLMPRPGSMPAMATEQTPAHAEGEFPPRPPPPEQRGDRPSLPQGGLGDKRNSVGDTANFFRSARESGSSAGSGSPEQTLGQHRGSWTEGAGMGESVGRGLVPEEVPQLPSGYVRRDRVMRALTLALEEAAARKAQRYVVLFSPSTSGKTVAAAAVTEEEVIRRSFRAGVIWLRVGRGVKQRMGEVVRQAIAQLLDLQGQAPHDLSCFPDDATLQEYLAFLGASFNARNCLVVLDDVWDMQVVEALELCGFCMLATSRNPSLVSSMASHFCLTLEEPSESECRVMLGGAAGVRRLPPVAEEVLRAVGASPLGLRLVGATAKHFSSPAEWSDLLQELRKSTPPALGLSSLGRSHHSVTPQDGTEAAVKAAMTLLPPVYQSMRWVLSVLPPGVPLPLRLLQALWKSDRLHTSQTCESLEARGFLRSVGVGCYATHHDVAPIAYANTHQAKRASAFSQLAHHLGTFTTLSDYIARDDLWTLLGLWRVCEVEAQQTSGRGHVACSIYRKGLETKRKVSADASIYSVGLGVPGFKSLSALLEFVGSLEALGDFTTQSTCECPAPELYQQAVDLLDKARIGAEADWRWAGGADGSLVPQVDTKLEQMLRKLAAALTEQGRPLEAHGPCARALAMTRERLGPGIVASDLARVLQTHVRTLMSAGEADEAYVRYKELAQTWDHLFGRGKARVLVATSAQDFGSVAQAAGELEKAKVLFIQSLDVRVEKEVFGPAAHPLAAVSMDLLAELSRAMDDLQQANEWYQRALRVRVEALGSDHPLVADVLEKQAQLSLAQGRPQEAQELLEECLSIRQRCLGDTNERVAQCCQAIADLLLQRLREEEEAQPQGPARELTGHKESSFQVIERPHSSDFKPFAPGHEALVDEVQRHLTQALTIYDKLGGEMDPRSASIRHSLARTLAENGQLDEAEPLYQQLVDQLEDAPPGTSKPGEFALALSGLINVQRAQGKNVVSLMWTMIQEDEKAFGSNSIQLARDLDRLGWLLYAQNEHPQAEQLFKRALHIKERKYGKSHAEVADSVLAIAQLLIEQKAFRDAQKELSRALELNRTYLGADHVNTIDCMRKLGLAYSKQNNYKDAEPLYRYVIKHDTKLYGTEEHPEVIQELNVLALLLYAQSKLDEAEPLMMKVLSLRERAFGMDHPDVADSLNNLAVLHNARGKNQLALDKLTRSLRILIAVYGEDHIETAATRAWLAETYQKLQNYPKAEEILKEVLVLHEHKFTPDHPLVAEDLSDMGELLRVQGKLEEAERCHMRALEIRTQQFGELHPLVAQSSHFLSLVLSAASRPKEAEKYQLRYVAIKEQLAARSSGRLGGQRQSNSGGRTTTPTQQQAPAANGHSGNARLSGDSGGAERVYIDNALERSFIGARRPPLASQGAPRRRPQAPR